MNNKRKDSFSSNDGSNSTKSTQKIAIKKNGPSKFQNAAIHDANEWPRDFAKSKAVLYCNMFDQNKPLVIHSSDDNFVKIFGRELNFRLCLDDYVGCSTSRETFNEIKLSIQQGKSTCVSTNLYHLNGTALACHISVTSIIGGKKYMMKSVSMDEDYVDNAAAPSTQFPLANVNNLNVPLPLDNNFVVSSIPMPSKSPVSVIPGGYLGTRWAVVTIHSAVSMNQFHNGLSLNNLNSNFLSKNNALTTSSAPTIMDDSGQFDLIKSNCMQLMQSWTSSTSTVIPVSSNKLKRKGGNSSKQTSLQGTPVKKTKIARKTQVSPTGVKGSDPSDVTMEEQNQQQNKYKYYEGELSVQNNANIMASPVKKSKNHQRKHPLQSRLNHQKSNICQDGDIIDVNGGKSRVQPSPQVSALINPKIYLATYLQSINSNATASVNVPSLATNFKSSDFVNNYNQKGSGKTNMSVVPTVPSYPLSQFSKSQSCSSALNDLSSSDTSVIQSHPILHSQSYDSYNSYHTSCQPHQPSRSPVPYELAYFHTQPHHNFSSSTQHQLHEYHHDTHSFHSHFRDPYLPPSTAVMMADHQYPLPGQCAFTTTAIATCNNDNNFHDKDDIEVQYINEKYSSPPRLPQQQHVSPCDRYNNLIDNTMSSSHFIENSMGDMNQNQVNNATTSAAVYGNRNTVPVAVVNNNSNQGPRYNGNSFVPLSASTNTVSEDNIDTNVFNALLNDSNDITSTIHTHTNSDPHEMYDHLSVLSNINNHHGAVNNNNHMCSSASASPGFVAILNSLDWDDVEDDEDFNGCFTNYGMINNNHNHDDDDDDDMNNDLRSVHGDENKWTWLTICLQAVDDDA